MLEAIKYIDVVLTFGDRKELEGLIQLYNPDILLLGSDWHGRDVVGIEHAKGVRFLPRVGGYASSKTIQRIKTL
jgi:D-beta-D-heptose 7-phosphate kinase/D-beta-D-heptose 1-phosphate adenosyltransferase